MAAEEVRCRLRHDQLARRARGRGLPSSYLRAYNTEEAKFVTPSAGELPPTSMGLIATTVAAYGTPEQKRRWMTADAHGRARCQLFSEPSAGSDLAALPRGPPRRRRVGAQRPEGVDVGRALRRLGPGHRPDRLRRAQAPRPHRLHGPVRSARRRHPPDQADVGGADFNEVFLTDVRVSDDLRLGPVGEGWRVALTCLGFERDHSGGGGGGHVGGGFAVLLTARHFGLTQDPMMRQTLADLYIQHRVAQMTNRRAAAAIKAGQTRGRRPRSAKLMWTANMTRVSDAISAVLGPALRPTPATGARTPGPSTCSARRAIGSRAVRTRSSATSSASGSSASPPSRGSTRTCPSPRRSAPPAAGVVRSRRARVVPGVVYSISPICTPTS